MAKKKIVAKKKMSEFDRRYAEIEKLKGKHNGWWIYQYCMGIFNERQIMARRKRR